MQRLILVSSILLCASAGALGCLNDSELPSREREFRSQYLETPLMTETDSSVRPHDRTDWIMASGVVLLSGALASTLFRRR